MYGYIYKFTLVPTGKIYVGKHKYDLEQLDESYWGGGTYWKSAVKQYGRENVHREVLEYCNSLQELNAAEKYWIDKLNSRDKTIGYNLSDGGDGNAWPKGKPMSEEAKLKNSVAHKELCKDPDYILKVKEGTKKAMARKEVRDKLKAVKLSDARKQHLRELNLGENNPNWGTHWTDERREKYKESLKISEKWKNHVATVGDKLRNIPKTEEHKKSLSDARKGKSLYTNGVESHLYKVGEQPKGYYKKKRGK